MRPTTLPPRATARLAEIDQKLAALLAEKRQLDSRRQAADRALRTRQNIIIGGWLLAHEPATFDRIKSQLTRDQDRAVFGLPPLNAATPTQAMDRASTVVDGAALGPASNGGRTSQGAVAELGRATPKPPGDGAKPHTAGSRTESKT